MNIQPFKDFVQQPAEPQDTLSYLAPSLFHDLGTDGVYGRTGVYESIVSRLASYISAQRPAGAEIMRFPPVISRTLIEKSGYLKSFPNLLGCVCGLHGSEREVLQAAAKHETGGDWTETVTPSDLVLIPAACYPVYPIVAKRGALPKGGVVVDVAADCFRAEPSKNLDRLQSFRMREYVCIGAPDDVAGFRDAWMEKAQAMAEALGLTFKVDVASDPFFGRVGAIKAVSQVQQALKFELLVPLRGEKGSTACMSFNYHRDHFGQTWDMKDASGQPAHTGCVAFGMDRLAVALFHIHGVDPDKWPEPVKTLLAL
jgi:seryl-tRNA synthetase